MMMCVSGCVLVLVLLLGPERARNNNAAPGPRVLYVLRLVCHLVSGECAPCPLLGALSCFTSSFVPPFHDKHLACWLSIIVSHDGQLILLYSLY
jgi:hypothetical protein